MKNAAAMTPYNLAVDLFQSGTSFDDVVARLLATGLTAEEARTAAHAASPKRVEAPAPTAQAGEAVAPGFHGWLLVVTILHGIYAAVTVTGLGAYAIAVPRLVAELRGDELVLAGLHVAVFFVATVLLIAGMVFLFQRKRQARGFLIAWTMCCLVLQLASLIFGEGSFTAIIISVLWIGYFNSSKQLTATLTR